MPDDGHRYELVEGVLLVTPAPFNDHQRATARLLVTLVASCPPELEILPNPRLQLTDTTQVGPDLVVIHREDYTPRYLTKPPPLVVEVCSFSTWLVDRNLKKAAHEAFDIPSYWLVNPDPDKPTLTVFELGEDGYHQRAHVADDDIFVARRPFPVEIAPRRLVDG